MSLHYEWVLSTRIRPDAPESFLAELRFHLGLGQEPPKDARLEYDWPCLLPDNDHALPGGSVQSFAAQQPLVGGPPGFGLFVRTFVLDDSMYDLMQTVPSWLAPWSLTQGWIGFAREELGLHPWLNFYVQDGFAYAAEPGGIIKSLDGSAPEFTLTQTTDATPPVRGLG